MLTIHRISRKYRLTATVLRTLLALFLGPAMLLAQTPVPSLPTAPVVPVAATMPTIPLPPGLEAEIQLLQQQVERLKTNWSAVKTSIPPVMRTAEQLDALPSKFAPRVDALKQQYNIPENPTLGQEARGLTRYGLDKAGVAPARADAIMKSIDQTAANARNYKPLDPMNIALAVGSVAGVNLIRQVVSTGQVDLAQAVGFLGTKQFWGGLVGSGVGYSLAGYALTSFLPPGGSLVMAVLPTFGAVTAGILGGHVGAAGFNMKDAFANINFGEVIGQAAGNTLGLFMGGAIGQFLGGTLGSMAGPVGTIVGSMMMGYLGGAIGKSLGAAFKGDTEPLRQALEKAKTALNGEGFRPSDIGVAEELPGAAFFNDTESTKIKASYRSSYTSFLEAVKKNDTATATKEYKKLAESKSQYEQVVRRAFRDMAAKQ
jgi:hypothetical protein